MTNPTPDRSRELQVLIARTPGDIARCFPALQELQPHLKEHDPFVGQILRQLKEGYTLSYVEDEGEVGGCIGFRSFETLAWGRLLYVDDLITRERSRKRGLARVLLAYAIEHARSKKCAEVHLDTGHHRHEAHRLYLDMGFKITCHHLALAL